MKEMQIKMQSKQHNEHQMDGQMQYQISNMPFNHELHTLFLVLHIP